MKCEGCGTYLDPRLVPRGGIVITRTNSLGGGGPQLPALPIALLFNGLDSDLGLGHGCVGEHFIRLGDLSDGRPVAFVRSDGLAVVREDSFERVGFAGDPAFALVFDVGDVASVRDNSGGVSELDVRGSPDETLNLESRCKGALADAPSRCTRKPTKSDQVRLPLSTGERHGQSSMSVLLDCKYRRQPCLDAESKNTHH